MYGLFTKLGLGAVVSTGLSVLGIGYLCTDTPPGHHQSRPSAVVAVQADAALGAGVGSPGSHGPGQGNGPGHGSPGNNQPGTQNPGSNPGSNPGGNPGSNPGGNQPGGNQPGPDCGCSNPPLVNVNPDVDVDVDVDVKLPETDLDAPELVGGVVGTVGVVVDGVLPDCGCTPSGSSTGVLLPVPLFGH